TFSFPVLPHRPPLFPYTTLFRSRVDPTKVPHVTAGQAFGDLPTALRVSDDEIVGGKYAELAAEVPPGQNYLWHTDHYGGRNHFENRKSTRLNSSHVKISYAVFCL